MKGTRVLELRLAVAATPARIARATRMIHEVVEAGFPAQRDRVTVVVENDPSRITMKGWTHAAIAAVAALGEFIRNPTESVTGLDTAAVAEPLERYCCDEIAYGPAFWLPGSRKRPLRAVDREFIDHLHVVATSRPRVRDPLVSGTTVVVSPVLRVGRTNDGAETKARINLPGLGTCDVGVDDAVYSDLCDAVKRKVTGRLRLLVEWRRVATGDLEIDPTRTTVLGFESRGQYTTGARMVEIATSSPALTADELDEVLQTLREERGE